MGTEKRNSESTTLLCYKNTFKLNLASDENLLSVDDEVADEVERVLGGSTDVVSPAPEADAHPVQAYEQRHATER